MSDNKFKPGDVVILKSGGPDMTYEYENQYGRAVCSWFPSSSERKQESFAFEALKLANDE